MVFFSLERCKLASAFYPLPVELSTALNAGSVVSATEKLDFRFDSANRAIV
jgi:hypothetical protein